ncbi:hypothetical protein GWK47_040126 [Chionoecetes opilio]|uniref:Uncharacterized protein n=1 Tax=Chionoecetes opilio TaxID=41210 RepID=A0A8J4YCG8_CHIOP|nr:hypothetical protein GWK47_040126 [Chionoecetes opilio]
MCARTILLAQSKAWGSHCASLSPSSSTKRTWDFFHSTEGKKQRLSLPLKDGANPLLDDPQKAALLAAHYQDKIGLRCPLASSLTIDAAINTAVASPGIPALTRPFTTDEMDRVHLKTGENCGPG